MPDKKNIASDREVSKKRIQKKLAKIQKVKNRIGEILERKRAKKNMKNKEKKLSKAK